MANTQAICTSFKVELFQGKHALGTTVVRATTAKDAVKAALYLASASRGAGDTVYTTTGEVSGTNYTAGGVVVTNATEPTNTGTTAHWTPSANIAYTNVTLNTAFDAALLYNSTQGNAAIGVYTFGAQTVTAANFTLNVPVNDGTTGLLRLT